MPPSITLTNGHRGGRLPSGAHVHRIRRVLRRDRQAFSEAGTVAPSRRRPGRRPTVGNWHLPEPQLELFRGDELVRARSGRRPRRLASRGLSRHLPIHDRAARHGALLAVSRTDPVSEWALFEAADEWLGARRAVLATTWQAVVHSPYPVAAQLDSNISWPLRPGGRADQAQAREWLDSSPRSSWLQYAPPSTTTSEPSGGPTLLTDLGFDAAGDPVRHVAPKSEARQANSLGIITSRGRQPGIPPCGNQTRTGRRAQGAGSACRRLGAIFDRGRRRQVALGDLRFRAHLWPARSPSRGSGRTPI